MKKILSLLLAVLLVSALFVSCAKDDVKNDENDTKQNAPADTSDESSADDKKEPVVIKVAASSTPHAEILEQCKPLLSEKGYDLEIMVMDDYIIPNNATESGDVDANYFQHQPYLDQFNADNGTHLVSVAKIHYEPYAIYAGTASSLEDIKEGASIAVPNDATNEARALLLLEANGLIKLKDDAGLTATKSDIVENSLNIDIREMEAALIPSVLDEVAVAVINGNYAIQANLKVSESLAMEDPDSEAAQTYANVLVVKEGNENSEAVKALIEALTSDTIRDYINNTYDKAVLPIF